MADRLVAWLSDTPVAALVRGPEFRIRLAWRPEGIERWGLGSPALSVGLPIGAPVGPRDLRPAGMPAADTPLCRPGGLRQVIGALDVAPLGAAPERGFRPSLAGVQRKALLGRAADGSWQLPSGDAPSTWILKPDGPQATAANEITCASAVRPTSGR